MATGSGARQIAPAFQDSFSFRGAPVSGGASDEVLQIGNSEKSMPGAGLRNGKACAPITPIGAASAAAAPLRNKVRRSSNALAGFSSFDIFFSCFLAAQGRHRRNSMTLRPVTFHMGINEFGSLSAGFQIPPRSTFK